MALTPQEIHAKEFTTRSNKWYDRMEVNEFLDQVVTDYDALMQENAMLKTKLADADAASAQVEEMKQSVNSSILIAQEAADRLKKQTEAEAEATLQQAQAEAQKIVMEANAKANSLISDSQRKNESLVIQHDALEKDMGNFKGKLQRMLEAQMDLLKTDEWDAFSAPARATTHSVTQTAPVAEAASSAASVASQSSNAANSSQVVTEVVFPSDKKD